MNNETDPIDPLVAWILAFFCVPIAVVVIAFVIEKVIIKYHVVTNSVQVEGKP